MEPGLDQSRRGKVQLRLDGEKFLIAVQSRRVVLGKGLCIELLYHAEPAKFAFGTIPVPMVIAKFGRELALRDFVKYLDPRNYLDWKGERRLPVTCELLLIVKI